MPPLIVPNEAHDIFFNNQKGYIMSLPGFFASILVQTHNIQTMKLPEDIEKGFHSAVFIRKKESKKRVV